MPPAILLVQFQQSAGDYDVFLIILSTYSKMRSRRQKLYRKRYTRKGGAFKGQGVYGCTFVPPIRCKGEGTRRRGVISKLMLPHEADKEYLQKTLLSPIDRSKRFFIWPEHMCEPEYEAGENNLTDPANASKRCIVGAPNIRTRNPKLILFENGGQDLSKTRLAVVPDEGYEIYLTGKDVPFGSGPDEFNLTSPADKGEFLTGLSNLLHGLVTLHAAEIVHFDIKMPNIVAQKRADGSFNIRFIDFGLSKQTSALVPLPTDAERKRIITESLAQKILISGSKLSEHLVNFQNANVVTYTQNYAYWPYDLRFLHTEWRNGNNVTDADIDNFYGPTILNYGHVPTWMWYDKGGPILKTVKGREILLATRQTSHVDLAKATDIYAIGRELATIFRSLTGQESTGQDTQTHADRSPIGRKLKATVSGPFWRLVCRMLSPDIRVRPTAAEAAAEYDALIPDIRQIYGLPVTAASGAPSAASAAPSAASAAPSAAPSAASGSSGRPPLAPMAQPRSFVPSFLKRLFPNKRQTPLSSVSSSPQGQGVGAPQRAVSIANPLFSSVAASRALSKGVYSPAEGSSGIPGAGAAASTLAASDPRKTTARGAPGP